MDTVLPQGVLTYRVVLCIPVVGIRSYKQGRDLDLLPIPSILKRSIITDKKTVMHHASLPEYEKVINLVIIPLF